jgi:hypothetical protein
MFVLFLLCCVALCDWKNRETNRKRGKGEIKKERKGKEKVVSKPAL